MSTLHRLASRHAKVMGVACALFVWAGCATAKVDWNNRIGAYTLDQAIIDLGPPDKEAALSDGTRVMEWLTAKGYTHGSFSPMWGSRFYSGPWVFHYVDPPAPDHYLRLVFSSDGKLRSWRKVMK